MQKEIRITVSAPVDCTSDQFEEWVNYCLGYTGQISISNPLHEYDLEAEELDIQ